MNARPLWFRFRLRTLLFATLVFGGGLGWWLRPHTISRRWPNGRMQYELNVRRTWKGELLTNGRQRWWWSNGQLARSGVSRGQLLPRDAIHLHGLEQEVAYYEDGQRFDNPRCVRMYWHGDVHHEEPSVDWSIYRFAETEHDP